ncbi:Acetolactate synthase catalytic subunit [Burkholderiales bacterium 8X]|nr:Acetolactate synthase catalytic subunit [Burkholderiales bacterium 8X]
MSASVRQKPKVEPHAPVRPRENFEENNVGTAMALAMRAAGIDTVFGQCCPIPFFIAADRAGIRQIGYRTENAGVVMADGYARSTGRIGVVAAQNGPAAALLVAGLAEALKASIPLLALVQDIPRSGQDRHAFQDLDHEAMFKPVAKWVRKIPMASRAGEYVERAIRAACTGRPGPAVLIVPHDMVNEAVADTRPPIALAPEMARVPVDRFLPSRQTLSKAAKTLMAAKRPLIVAGGGVHSSKACASLVRLQEAWQVPVATTNMGKGSIDESHPLSIGVVGYVMGARSPSRHLLDYVRSADAVLFVGTRTNENGTASWTLFDSAAQFMQIDVDPDEIGRNYPCQRLLGDAGATLDGLLEEGVRLGLDHHAGGAAVRDLIATARALHRADLEGSIAMDAMPMRPERLVRQLSELAGPEAIWVADASYSSLWVAQYVPSRRAGQRFITPRGLGGLGWGLPLAVGSKLGCPDRTVIAVVGDGGFAHCWSELETAKRHGVKVIVVVLNNAILGFQRDAELCRFGRFAEVCAIGPFDHVAIARACGCDGIVIDDPHAIRAAFDAAMASPLPFVIDALVDPEAFPPITAFDVLLGHENGTAAGPDSH